MVTIRRTPSEEASHTGQEGPQAGRYGGPEEEGLLASLDQAEAEEA